MGETKLTIPAENQIQTQSLEELRQRASKDALSGLLNRATMEQCVKARLAAMAPEETCALFIVDLDDFKQVNDTLGHRAGDQAIRQAGRVLSRIFRGSDIVGRLGGDEFAVFLCGDVTEELVREKAAAICQRLQLALGDRAPVHITASVGVHIAEKGQQFDGLYQAADLALYKAKKAGKHQYCLKGRDGYQKDSLGGIPRPVNTISLSWLLEQMDSGVALLELGTSPQLIYVSPSFCRIVGMDIKDLPLPLPLTQLIHPDDLVSLEQALRAGLQSEEAAEHTHRITVDGGRTWHWWHVRANRTEYDGPNPVMLVTAIDVSRFKEEELRQSEQIRRLQAALDQTSKQLWEVDIPSGTFHSYTRDGKYQTLGEGKIPFPDNLIDGGWVHPNSVSRLRVFARELLDGQAQGFGNFAVRSSTGLYNWVSVSYRTLFDDVGRAARAVGVLEELPQWDSRGGWSPDRYPLPEWLLADLIVRMRANLNQDTVESLWVEGRDLSGQVQETRCSQILQMERQKIFCRGERRDFLKYFDRERLLQFFRAGHRWLCTEYRRADSGGSIRWVRHVLYLTENPASGEVYLFVYLIWLDPNHLLEPAVRREARRDPVTRLFHREAVREIAESLFSSRQEGNRAVALVQVNGLPQEPPAQGADADQTRYAVASALALATGGGCVVGQYSPNQFVVVFPSVTEKEELHHGLDETVAFLRRMLASEPACEGLRFLVGVQLAPASSAIYTTMLSQAARVCAFWWNAAADTVAFVPEDQDWNWAPLPSADREDRISVAPAAGRDLPLTEGEKDVAFLCMSAMLSARSLDASLRGVLRTVGEYYRADRVYTMMLTEGADAVIMTFEWTRAGKRSIQQVVSGVQLERFPLLKKCIAEGSPVFLDRTEPVDLAGGDAEAGPWRFAAFPLIREQRTEGFLCIENARERPENGALFSTLTPFLLQQRERFGHGERPTGTMERLMGLPDLRAYTQTVYTLTSEHYSSLGVVCLDIPGFAAVNSGQGFEYGSKMLWYVAETLKELFGSALLFRTWESEFIVFFPNTTRDVFLGRCGRLRSILQRRYPRQIRIGRAWADGVFTGRRLAGEAKAAMQVEFAGGGAYGDPLPIRPEDYSSVAEATQAGRFLVYYQPKVDMRTGALVGAEALVRAVDDGGSIVPPGRFIDFLEEDGSIRDLDLFVLDQVMAQADQWRALGMGVVPMAVNLSRVTLAYPSALASILAIQSRYPDIPASALELEITERVDGIKTSELQGIMERFHACGLHMSLDDFGSQYANFSLFTNVKFETVKLDRSLIAELTANPISRTLVRDLVQICRAYGMTCVAEGVETPEQISALLDMGCVWGQGYYYDRPMPAREFEEKYLRHPVQGK